MNQDREPLPTRVEGLPALPPAALELLNSGLDALGLSGLPAAGRTILVDHVRLLIAWNGSINLTAIRDPEAIVREHVLDSLTAVGVLREQGSDALLDLGSGGGYPGLPLAIALPARRALLVESVGKKAAFLSAAAAISNSATSTSLTPDDRAIDVFAGRAESLAADRRHRERWPAVVARAIAPLAELAELALPLVVRGGILVAWKRRPLDAELALAGAAIDRLGGGPASVVPVSLAGLEDHVLVIIDKVRPSPPGYPRDPARRRQQPIAPGDPLPSG